MSARRWSGGPSGLGPSHWHPKNLLDVANRLFEAERESLTVTFGPAGRGYVARFDYPGLVSVFCEASGVLLAKSKLRQPAVLAKVVPK